MTLTGAVPLNAMYLTGSHCENDYDGCRDNPCGEYRNCTDLPAEEVHYEGDNLVFYTCSGCQPGYELAPDGNKCVGKCGWEEEISTLQIRVEKIF